MKDKIDGLIRDISTTIGKSEKQELALNYHLSHMQTLLEGSKRMDETVDINKIREALQYMEGIPLLPHSFKWRYFLSAPPQTMGILLQNEREIILPESKSGIPVVSAPGLNTNQASIFVKIHKALYLAASTHLQYARDEAAQKSLKLPSVEWGYEYQKEDGKEVMNQAIGRWQEKLMNLSSNPKKAYDDFTRNFSIQGMIGATEKDVDCLLDTLVDGSNYPEEEKKAVKAWLQSNGNQENNRFFDLMLAQGDLTNGLPSSCLTSIPCEQNWSINKEGKIVLNLDVAYSALMINGDAFYNGSGGNLAVEVDVEKLSTRKTQDAPLLKMKACIQLEVDERGRVKPCIVALNVVCYNKELRCPELLEQGAGPHP